MDSLRITVSLSSSGSAVGDATNDELNTPLDVRLVASLASSGSAGSATFADDGLFYATRSLAGGASETFDLTSFTNPLKEAGSALTIVRGYFVVHSEDSLATDGIRVGGAATPYPGQLNTAATTRDLDVGCGFSELNPTAVGIAVTAGMGVKVENLSGALTATYAIGVFGE